MHKLFIGINYFIILFIILEENVQELYFIFLVENGQWRKTISRFGGKWQRAKSLGSVFKIVFSFNRKYLMQRY